MIILLKNIYCLSEGHVRPRISPKDSRAPLLIPQWLPPSLFRVWKLGKYQLKQLTTKSGRGVPETHRFPNCFPFPFPLPSLFQIWERQLKQSTYEWAVEVWWDWIVGCPVEGDVLELGGLVPEVVLPSLPNICYHRLQHLEKISCYVGYLTCNTNNRADFCKIPS